MESRKQMHFTGRRQGNSPGDGDCCLMKRGVMWQEGAPQRALPRCFPSLPRGRGGGSPPSDRPSTKGSLLEESQGVGRDPERGRGREKGTEKDRERREEEGKRSAMVTWDGGGGWGGE